MLPVPVLGYCQHIKAGVLHQGEGQADGHRSRPCCGPQPREALLLFCSGTILRIIQKLATYSAARLLKETLEERMCHYCFSHAALSASCFPNPRLPLRALPALLCCWSCIRPRGILGEKWRGSFCSLRPKVVEHHPSKYLSAAQRAWLGAAGSQGSLKKKLETYKRFTLKCFYLPSPRYPLLLHFLVLGLRLPVMIC